MTAYDPTQWHDLFVGVLSAAAALAGLLFVAVSINLRQILAIPTLPGRAAETVGILTLLLLESILVVVPGETRTALGTELWILGLVVVVGFSIAWSRRVSDRDPDHPLLWTVLPLGILLLSSLPTVIGGASLLANSGGGLYWLAGGLIAGFAGAVVNAWVLLVEILR